MMTKRTIIYFVVHLAILTTCSSLSLQRPILEAPTLVRASSQNCSRETFLTSLVATSFTLMGGVCWYPGASLAVESLQEEQGPPAKPISVAVDACPKTTQGSNNCVSTASVRQLDLYMSPWTFPKNMPTDEVIARLKGAVSTNNRLSEVLEQSENSLKVKAIRNFCKDEILFLVNTNDHVITFISRQVEGPDAPDFGENHKRLEDIRRRAGVFGIMGEDFSSPITTDRPTEGAFGQLKAFYGLQSGRGYEDVLLDED